MKKMLKCLILMASGILMGLVVAYFIPAAFEWVAMIPFAILVFTASGKDRKTMKRGLLLGFTYFYPYYLTVWYWFLTMYPLDFTELSRGAALVAILFAWVGLPLLQAVVAMWQIPLYLLAARSRFITNKNGARLTAPILFALIYIVFEWLQTLTWAGVPWGRLAIGQAYTPIFVGTASLLGSYFVSFVIVLVNGYIAMALISYRCGARSAVAAVSLGLAVFVFSLNLLGGVVVTLTREPDTESEKLTVGVLQGNISSKDKWSDDSFANLTRVYGDLSESAANDGADLVLWTETSLPYVINDYTSIYRFVENTAYINDVTLLATAFWRESGEEGGSVEYNSVMTVTPEEGIDTDHIYHKRRLVPFGEFVPYEELVKKLVPPLASLSMFDSKIASGEDANLQITECGKVGALVCFDSIYENYALDSVRCGAELLTISTNDSWFGDSAALYQHTAQAVLRAVETDRYIARAGNTGYSCVISPSGEIITSLPIDTEGYLVANVYRRNSVTIYSVVGNLMIVIAALAVAVVIVESIIYNRRKETMSELYVRAVRSDELEAVVNVYNDGRRAIATLSIDQWQDGYPPKEQTVEDIDCGVLYAAVDRKTEDIAAVAAMVAAPDPDYAVINGEWITDGDDYVAVHRVAASDKYRGRGASALLFAEIESISKASGVRSLRVDTHRGNVVMQRFLQKRGFTPCGEITIAHGDGDRIRRAYEKLI